MPSAHAFAQVKIECRPITRPRVEVVSALDKRRGVLLRVHLMSDFLPSDSHSSGLEVRTRYVRERNVLVAQAVLSELYVDYYLHLGENKLKPDPAHDAVFKRALAFFVLHCASRPQNEITAWTINLQEPRVNLFLTGNNNIGAITGRIFAENVKEFPENLFYSDVIRGAEPKRRSVVPFSSADPAVGAEEFYTRSEQRPVRFFQLVDEEFALVTEHPDCDRTWFGALDAERVRTLESHETVTPLETRHYRWHCGCNQERMLQVLAPVMKQDAEGLFGATDSLTIHCPRCAALHTVTRESLEAYVVEHP